MSIYLDNAATTKPCDEAVAAAVDAMTVNFGNPSSLHRAGLDAQLIVDKSRKIIADSLGTSPETIFFTSGATESNNLALRGAVAAYGKRRRKIVASAVEHASVEETLKALERNDFEVVRILPRQNGEYVADDFIAACDENTVLLTMMYINNETGAILPAGDVFNAVKRRFPEIITHSDCVQAYMKFPVRASALNADLISLSAHKIHGVKGSGALYVKKGIRVLPIMTGGRQEKGIRSGTESVPLIAAFGAAVMKLNPTINERFVRAGERKLYFEKLLSGIDGVVINSVNNSPYITNIAVMGKRSEIMLHFLESRGIYVSSGSACSKGKQSGVLEKFGISDKAADSALRISITSETTEGELDELVLALRDGIEKIRG